MIYTGHLIRSGCVGGSICWTYSWNGRENGNAFRILMWKLLEMHSIERSRKRWQDSIKTDFSGIS
jgi:hypothetical protein